jgi:predicted lactoylglutathione lyase
MTDTRPRKLLVNPAVRDLERSKAFFANLGFGFNPKFTNESGACMLVGSRVQACRASSRRAHPVPPSDGHAHVGSAVRE